MYGLNNKALGEMIRNRFGERIWEAIVQKSGLDASYLKRTRAYPNAVIGRLMRAASEVLGLPSEDLIATLGASWILHTTQKGSNAAPSLSSSQPFSEPGPPAAPSSALNGSQGQSYPQSPPAPIDLKKINLKKDDSQKTDPLKTAPPKIASQKSDRVTAKVELQPPSSDNVQKSWCADGDSGSDLDSFLAKVSKAAIARVPHEFSLSPKLFGRVFPFHFACDRNLNLVQLGDVLQRICPEIQLGDPLDRHFRLQRPNIQANFDTIREHPRSLFVLVAQQQDLQLKGQMVYEEEAEIVMFLGSPWITKMEDLETLGLNLKDFAIHDPLIDLLFLLQAQNTALADAKQLNSALTQQQTELCQANQQLLERSRLSTLAAEVGVALGQEGGLTESLHRCMQIFAQQLDADCAGIWTFDQASEQLKLQAITGQSPYLENIASVVDLGTSILGNIAQNRHPYFTNDVATDACLNAEEWGNCKQLAAFAGYPLVVENRLVGTLALFSRQPLSSVAHSMLEWIANSLAVAIDRIWAREELLSRREALLFQLASQIRDSLDLDTILGTAVKEIHKLLQIDRCYFLRCWQQAGSPSLAVTHEARNLNLPSWLGERSARYFSPLVDRIQNSEMMRTDDVACDRTLDVNTQKLLASEGISAQLFLPLQARSGQRGAIVCSHSGQPRPWSDSEVELLQAVVDQLAIALDQAELYTQTRAAAFDAQTQAQQLRQALRDLKQAQVQLIQSEKMSSLGQMVAGVAHEINNPTSFIHGNLTHASRYIQDLLSLIQLYQQRYPQPGKTIEAAMEEIDLDFLLADLPNLMDSMQVGADRIRQIVMSLRNFSRLDQVKVKAIDIHDGINDTLMILRNRLEVKPGQPNIQVVKEYGQIPKIECYSGQLNQVFMNILANAIDALESSERSNSKRSKNETLASSDCPADPLAPSIRIRTEVTDRDTVTISIVDNGPGISESVRKRLFDPFFTTKPVGKGTGLGLSISYQIVVEKHSGQLKCLSQLGQGCEFQIEIPIKQAVD